MKKNLIILFSFISIIGMNLLSMEQPNNYYSIILPGQNGLGGDSFIKNSIVNTKDFTCYKTVVDDIDLGQTNCINHFDKQFKNDQFLKNNKKTKIILYGISQGYCDISKLVSRKNI